jgi:hypothetical protein
MEPSIEQLERTLVYDIHVDLTTLSVSSQPNNYRHDTGLDRVHPQWGK